MNVYKFYLGSSAVVVFSDVEICFEDCDKKFLRPVMRESGVIKIFIRRAEQVGQAPADAVDCGFFKVWEEDGAENRLYCDGRTHSFFAHSCRRGKNMAGIEIEDSYAAKSAEFFRIWSYCHLEELLLENDAFVLHSASIIYRGKAILFTAPSGTGKTTQSDLWREYMPGVEDINGDKTLLQLLEGKWYASGFPTSGSSVYCEQTAAAIGAIVILRQAPYNRISELTDAQKIIYLYSETTVFTTDPREAAKAMDLFENLVRRVRVLMLECRPEKESADLLHGYLFGDH